MEGSGFVAFGRSFSERVRNWQDDLRNLEHEGCTYEEWWLDDELGGPGLYRVDLTPGEIYQYVRAIVGWDDYLDGGLPAVGDRDLAREAEESAQIRRANNPGSEGICAADFLGDNLEGAVCGMSPGRGKRVHPVGSARDALAAVHDIASSLPTAIKALTDRGSAPAFEVKAEKDLQDVLFVILRSLFDDTRREEWTPSSAGNAKRVDLMIPNADLLIETKFVRNARHARTVADELRVDFESYHSHPACKAVFALVWDPKRLIADPKQLERDLSAPRTKGTASFDATVRVV